MWATGLPMIIPTMSIDVCSVCWFVSEGPPSFFAVLCLRGLRQGCSGMGEKRAGVLEGWELGWGRLLCARVAWGCALAVGNARVC